MSSITAIYAREILDSRGWPTIECSIWLDTGLFVTTSTPSGTSKSTKEAFELRDNDANHMGGRGVLQAVRNINEVIAPQLIGKDPTQQTEIDQLLINLDGTVTKNKLGANAIVAVSQAVLKAGAQSLNLPLYYYIQQKYQLTNQFVIPTCIYTMINGGDHGTENLDIQEFQVIPASHVDYATSLSMAVSIYQQLEQVLISKGAIHSVGIVGGFTPNLFNNSDAFELLIETIKTTPYTFAQDMFFGCDIEASSLYENGKYALKDKSQASSAQDLQQFYKSLRTGYHVIYIEDPYHEDDWKSWQKITAEMGSTTLIAGDTLLATNLELTTKAIQEKACNSIVVKPNQIGTISETIQVIQEVRKANWQVVVSHRSGETSDDFIADFAVGVGANYVKFGPPNRGERVVKYNRLSRIYQEILQLTPTTTETPVAATKAVPATSVTPEAPPAT